MDLPDSYRVDFFEIYQKYCDIRSGKAYEEASNGQGDEAHRSKFSRDALAQLLKFVELKVHTRISIFDELFKLMSKLGYLVDFYEFARFYDFVFLMCRENGQKNITVSKAVMAWKLVLAGRFRLLKQWCEFVEENQRHNISEDTWQQVLAFSRCVHENLEGYDPEGAWPVLIDDFVEHMYRISGSNKDCVSYCTCGDTEFQSCTFDDSLPGLKITPGLKRKLSSSQKDEMDASDTLDLILSFKRNKLIDHLPLSWEDNPPVNSSGDSMDITKHSSPLGCTKSPCAVEGCLSKGFAGLLSSPSYLRLDQERRVSYT